MRYARAGLLLGGIVWLALVPAVSVGTQAVTQPVQGQDVLATPEVPQEATVPATGGLVKPTVKIERQGRLLVLRYQGVGPAGGSQANAGPQAEPPTFTIYQGPRKVTSGQFEYG